jgi:hypothetical protein
MTRRHETTIHLTTNGEQYHHAAGKGMCATMRLCVLLLRRRPGLSAFIHVKQAVLLLPGRVSGLTANISLQGAVARHIVKQRVRQLPGRGTLACRLNDKPGTLQTHSTIVAGELTYWRRFLLNCMCG